MIDWLLIALIYIIMYLKINIKRYLTRSSEETFNLSNQWLVLSKINNKINNDGTFICVTRILHTEIKSILNGVDGLQQ